MFNKKTIRDINIEGRTVLVRTDFNVPLDNGQVADDYRIIKSLPTLHFLRERGCKIIIISHLGRPDGSPNLEFSLAPVAEKLGQHLGIGVKFIPQCIGEQVSVAAKQMNPADVILLENVRFHPEEEANDRTFAQQLAVPAEYFVQDGFGVVHRAHASTSAVTEFLPSVAGFLVEEEVRQLKLAIENPLRPLVAILGGSKISDKIGLINRLLLQANTVIVAGAMANTFLKAKGYNIGQSKYNQEDVKEAEHLISEAERAGVQLVLPEVDLAVADQVDDSVPRREVGLDQVQDSDMILDFGQQSVDRILSLLEHSGTVIWNGPIGVIELPQFAQASERIARFIAEKRINCIVGGGDTAGFVHGLNLTDQFTHVSTGGGASLELLEGKDLPGISALLDK